MNARRFTRLVAALGSGLLVTTLLLPTAGSAQGNRGEEYGESGVGPGGVVSVGARWESVPIGGRSAEAESQCENLTVDLVVEDDFQQAVNRQWTRFTANGDIPFTAGSEDLRPSLPTYLRHFSPTGRWYQLICDGLVNVLPEGGPAVNIAGLVLEALDEVDPPDPELAVVPTDLHVAQLDSWLAIEPGYMVDRIGDAEAGRVQVIATVSPYRSEWDMGNGDEVECEGGGNVWRPGADPEDPTNCLYTYTESSAGQPGDAFDVTATVFFSVSVTTNAPGSYGPFPDIERATTQSVQVGEIQAVND